MALITASRKATGFHNLVSFRSLGVIFANVLFSTPILSNTCLVAFINEQYPYSLFSIKSTRSKPSYFATFTDIPLVSANKYAT